MTHKMTKEKALEVLPFFFSGEYSKTCGCKHCKAMPEAIHYCIDLLNKIDYRPISNIIYKQTDGMTIEDTNVIAKKITDYLRGKNDITK